MDIHSIDRFCERWINKAEAYRSEDLEDLFDRFFTLFVAFNRIYSAAAEMSRDGLPSQLAVRFRGDRQEATTVMARLIKQSRFTDAIEHQPAIAVACQTISMLLQNQRFFLHSFRDRPGADVARDMRLADGLRGCALMAVLECLYQIRCNIFHGEKDFAPKQAELLIPANMLLETIVSMSRETLRNTMR
jgi:hypothetical protein